MAVIVETATDNPIRTVAKVRAVFNKCEGSLGTSGSVAFQFKHMGVFKLNPEGLDQDELELELIDFGLEEMGEGSDENDNEVLLIRVPFEEFGNMQKGLEEKGIEAKSSELQWIPMNTVALSGEAEEDVLKLIAKMEEEEDVQRVFHNLS